MSSAPVIAVIDWGDDPTWLAFSTAALAALGAYMLLKVEQDRDRLRRDEEQRWQAENVAVWPEVESASGRPFRTEGAAVGNNSPLPIYDVRVTWWYPAGGVEGAPLEQRYEQPMQPVVPPGGDFLRINRHAGTDGPPHRRDNRRVVNPATSNVLVEGYQDQLDWFRLSIELTDTAGTRWLRGTNGRLSRILPAEGVLAVPDDRGSVLALLTRPGRRAGRPGRCLRPARSPTTRPCQGHCEDAPPAR